MYRLLATHKDELAGNDGPLADLRTQSVRFVYRNTKSYGVLQDSLRNPRHLRDGADWSIQLDRLARAALREADHMASPPASWRLVLSERHQLMHGDMAGV